MEHVWQSLQQEEGAEGRDGAANGLQQDGCTDGPKNGTNQPAAQPREKCWIHRVRALLPSTCMALSYFRQVTDLPRVLAWHGSDSSAVLCLSSLIWMVSARWLGAAPRRRTDAVARNPPVGVAPYLRMTYRG